MQILINKTIVDSRISEDEASKYTLFVVRENDKSVWVRRSSGNPSRMNRSFVERQYRVFE